MKKIVILLVFLISTKILSGQISYTGGTYSQDFNSFLSPVPGNNTVQSTPAFPLGWLFSEAGTGANTTYRVHNGGGNAGDTYVFGATGSAERAIGGLASGSLTSQWGAFIVNNTGYTLNEITINYKGEQWRDGGSATSITNTISFAYSIGASSLTSGTYINVSALDFVAPVNNIVADVILDGNLPANQVLKSHTITGLTWTNGAVLYIRWSDINEVGNDDGMGIDDFSFSAQGTPPAPLVQDNNITFPTVLPNAITANWTNGDGTSRIVKISDGTPFTNPTDGSNPTANSNYSGSGEQVVYNGSGSSVNVTGLSPNTTYDFRVYAYNGSGSFTAYNVTTAVGNPNSQITQPASTPLITVTGTLTGFGDVLLGNFSAEQTYTVEGSNLTDDILLGAPVGFEISTSSGSGFSNSITLPESGGLVATTTIYVRFTPAAIGSASGSIAHSSTGASTVNLPVSGNGVEPVITVNQTSLNFNNVFIGSNSANQVFTVKGDNLLADIIINTNPDFQISTNPVSGFGPSLTLTASGLSNPGGGTIPLTTIYVRFSPLTAGPQNSTVVNTSTGALTQTINVSGTGIFPPAFTELVVPQYMGSKSSASNNNSRTPIAICIQLDNLQPFTSYDVKLGFGLVTDAPTTYGAGNFWNGSSFNSTPNILGAFFTDANGSSGPVWLYMQPTGNSTRFDAGQVHNIRFGYAISGNSMPSIPQFVGTKTITCLDVPNTARTVGTTDDGAYLRVQGTVCNNGKYILIYNNVGGTGDPIFSYQARNSIATNTSQSDMPALINEIFSQTGSSVSGDYAAVIPIGANNPDGIRRIEARNADNTIFKVTTDADGIWNSGANTTNNLRRSVTTITATDGLNNVTASVSGDTIVCSGNPVNLTFNFTGVAPFTYIFSDGTNNFGPYFSFTNTDTKTVTPSVSSTYSVVAIDDAQCTGVSSGTAFVFVSTSAPAASVTVPITGLPANACNGTTVSIGVPFVAGATQYTWDAPAGSYFNGNPLNISPFVTTLPTVTLTFGNPISSGYYIGVQAGNPCGNSFRKSQWVRSIVSSPVISGAKTICPSGSEIYTVNPVVGAADYTWSGPAGSTINGNPTPFTTASTSVTLSVDGLFTSGTMCVTANTSCYSTLPKCISISKAASQPGIMNGVFSVCPNTVQNYSVPSAGPGSYTWVLPANASGSSTSNSINVTFSSAFTGGNISVSYTNQCGETSILRTKSISIGSPLRPASITGAANGVCGQTIIYSCPPQLGVSAYNWVLTGGATGSSATNTIAVTFPSSGFTTGTISVSASNLCGTSADRVISIKGAPNTPGVILPTPSTWCNNDPSITFNADITGISGVYTLNWSWIPATAATLVSGQGTNSLIVDWNTGNASVNLTASNGCGSGTRSYNASTSCREAVGVSAIEIKDNVFLYPNPASEKVFITIDGVSEQTVLIKLKEVTGRLLLVKNEFKKPGQNVSLDVKSFSKGTYIVEIMVGNKVYNSKLVLQ